MLSRSLLAIVGTLLEWAEYTFYAYMAYPLSQLFFPEAQTSSGLFSIYGIFAFGYLMRPLGGIIFGHIGDRWGRKPALTLSLLLMALATMTIGLLPTHAQVGTYAVIGLALCRLLQGLAMGGEYLGAGIYLIEHAKRYPYFAGSWVACAAASGMVLGAAASYLVSMPDMPAWAWRVPFLASGILCLAGYLFRKNLTETPEFQQSAPQKSLPLATALRFHKMPILRVGSISAFVGIFVYIVNIYYLTFLMEESHLSHHEATRYVLLGQLLVALLIPLMGYCADRGNANRQFCLGLVASALSAPVIFYAGSTGNHSLIMLAIMLYAVTNAIVSGPMLKVLYDAFPTRIRYSGMGFAYNIGAVLFSGTALMVAQGLREHTGWILAPSYYVSFFALLALLIFIKSNKKIS